MKQTIKEFFKSLVKLDKENIKIFFIGLSSFLIFAPFNIFPIGIITFGLFLHKSFQQKNLQNFQNKFFYFFLGFFLSNFYWISFSFLTNKAFILLFPLVFILIPTYFAIISTLLFTPLFFIKNKFKTNLLEYYLCFSLFLFAHEIIRGHISFLVDFKGFPWNLLGYSFDFHIILMQIVSIIGIYGLTLLACFLFPLGAFIVEDKRHIKPVTTILIIFTSLLALFGKHHLNSDTIENKDITLEIVHTNISKHHNNNAEFLVGKINHNIDLINQSNSNRNIIILTEGTISFLVENNQSEAFLHISEYIQNKNYDYLLTGAPRQEIDKNNREKYFNSLFLNNSEGEIIDFYDKTNLVPFGEYNPYTSILPNIATSKSFSKGKELKTLNLDKYDISIIPLICYDAIFPGKMSKTGDFLLNITNDIWFTKKILGKNISNGPHHHMAITKIRAIEEGKPFIRTANYGITIITDSFGHIKKSLNYYSKEQPLTTNLPPKLKTPTFYNQYRDLFSYITFTLSFIAISCLTLYRKTKNS